MRYTHVFVGACRLHCKFARYMIASPDQRHGASRHTVDLLGYGLIVSRGS